MSSRSGVIARRPLVTTATLAAFVAAVLSLLTAFGVPLSDAQQAAVSGLAAVLAPLVVALVGHRLVTPTADPRDRDGRQLVPAAESAELAESGPAEWPGVPEPRWPSE